MPLPWTQSFITPPIRSLPPPSGRLVAPNWLSRPTACWTDVGSYNSKLFIVFGSPASGALERREHLLACDRHFGDPRAHRVVDRGGDRGRGRRHRRLANAVRTEHPVLLRVLNQDDLDILRGVLDAQRLVVEHVRV